MHVKERIVEKAAEMFIKSGIKAITMDDISSDAGVSKRTIYEIFKDKDDLLRSCLSHLDAVFSKDKLQARSEAKNTIDLVFRFIKLGVAAIKTINPLFTSDLKKYHYRIWKETYRKYGDEHQAHIRGILEKGIEEGLFRGSIDVEIVGKLLNEQLRIISDEDVFPSIRFSREAVYENVVINFFRGIATKKGLDMIEKYLEDEADQFVTVG
ncbi:MAG: TetR/AcrR family transcriptional regulator [Marinilabiliales bacterium]|nr:MAG: TetR/AcrR family transcriptional regulator [Marinilabiliales bacterium]